jgi:hypothetical protein
MRIYKELKKLNIKKQTIQLINGQMNRTDYGNQSHFLNSPDDPTTLWHIFKGV